MKRFVRNLIGLFRRQQAGFTLVELLVVVGIIVALAAVIIPNVASFTGKGDEGSADSETANVQAAMDNMMADKGVTAVTASSAGAGTNDWSALPTGGTGVVALGPSGGGYMRGDTTEWTYCWDTTGLVTGPSTTSSPPTNPTCP